MDTDYLIISEDCGQPYVWRGRLGWMPVDLTHPARAIHEAHKYRTRQYVENALSRMRNNWRRKSPLRLNAGYCTVDDLWIDDEFNADIFSK